MKVLLLVICSFFWSTKSLVKIDTFEFLIRFAVSFTLCHFLLLLSDIVSAFDESWSIALFAFISYLIHNDDENGFCRVVEWWKVSLFPVKTIARDFLHHKPQKEFEFRLIEWSCKLVITTIPWRQLIWLIKYNW